MFFKTLSTTRNAFNNGLDKSLLKDLLELINFNTNIGKIIIRMCDGIFYEKFSKAFASLK